MRNPSRAPWVSGGPEGAAGCAVSVALASATALAMASASGSSCAAGASGSGVGVGSGAAAVSVGWTGGVGRAGRGGGRIEAIGPPDGVSASVTISVVASSGAVSGASSAGASETSGFTGWSRTSGAVSTSGSGVGAGTGAMRGASLGVGVSEGGRSGVPDGVGGTTIWSVTSASGASGAGGCGSGSGCGLGRFFRLFDGRRSLFRGGGLGRGGLFDLRRGDGRFQHHRRRFHPRRQGLELRHRQDRHAGHLELHLRAVAEQCAAERDPQKDPGMDRR
jgi:hypothetical protein